VPPEVPTACDDETYVTRMRGLKRARSRPSAG